eukprot:1157243-Pelagomonas_calceolata.AAC.10
MCTAQHLLHAFVYALVECGRGSTHAVRHLQCGPWFTGFGLRICMHLHAMLACFGVPSASHKIACAERPVQPVCCPIVAAAAALVTMVLSLDQTLDPIRTQWLHTCSEGVQNGCTEALRRHVVLWLQGRQHHQLPEVRARGNVREWMCGCWEGEHVRVWMYKRFDAFLLVFTGTG